MISKMPPNPNHPAILCSSLCKYRFLWKRIIKVFLGSAHSLWLHQYLGSQAPSCCSLGAAAHPALPTGVGLCGASLVLCLQGHAWNSCSKPGTGCFWQSCAKEMKICQLLFPGSFLGVPASPNTSPVAAIPAPGRIPTQLHMDGSASTWWGVSQGTSPNWSSLLNSLCGCL